MEPTLATDRTLADLEAERDRYRTALEQIVTFKFWDGYKAAFQAVRRIARAALDQR